MTDHGSAENGTGVDPRQTTVHEALGEVRKRLDPGREGGDAGDGRAHGADGPRRRLPLTDGEGRAPEGNPPGVRR